MSSKVATTSSATTNEPAGLGPRKTLFVLVTVVGCIAILWPKIFHPMMFGAPNQPPKPLVNQNYRPGGGSKFIFLFFTFYSMKKFYQWQNKNENCTNKLRLF